jgi:Uma2 family endonuclease
MARITPSIPLDHQDGSYRLSVHQYERMADAGILTGDDRVELLDGDLIRKMTKGQPHTAAIVETRDALLRVLPPGWHLQQEGAVRIPPFDEPEPDLAIVRGKSRDYVALKRPPEPQDIAMVIEVADASLARDRGEKLRAYARGGILMYWIVNLVDRRLEIYTQPQGSGYADCQVLGPDETAPVVIDQSVVGNISVAELLP